MEYHSSSLTEPRHVLSVLQYRITAHAYNNLVPGHADICKAKISCFRFQIAIETALIRLRFRSLI